MKAILVACILLIGGCKKKDENKPAEPAGDKQPPAAQDAAAAAAPPADAPPPIDAAPPDAAVVTIENAADYEAKQKELAASILGVFTTAKKDCDKIAVDLTKVLEDRHAVIEGIRAFEKANPAAKKAFDKKMKPKEKEFEAKIGPSMEACQEHEGVQKAVQLLPD